MEQFNIGANVVEVASGPSVTRYEIQLAPGIKVSKIVSLADNLAMSLAAIDVRVEAPIPGKSAIGVEVPNATPVMVTLRECLESDEFKNATSKLTVALGKDVSGQYKYADLTKMPHLLIGGSTNSGKSVCLNVLIASLVYRNTPRDVKMLMIDPKRVELSLWDGIPHLMHPVVKDVKQAAGIFRAALREMDRRYDLFATLGTRNIDGYNQQVPESETLPYLVLIVDELADLMMQQGPEVEHKHLPPGATGPRNRNPSRDRHAAPVRRHHYGNHQGQHLLAHRVCRRLAGGQPHDSGYDGRGSADRPGRYAVHAH